MPSGAKPGERRGGRGKGARNKSTIERERIAAEIAKKTVMDAREGGKPLAKEVLEKVMLAFASIATTCQPSPTNPNANEKRFLEYAKLAADVAGKLAPFQSPTFRAIAITPAPLIPGDNARPTDGKVIDLTDPNEIGRIYRQMVTARTGT